MKLWFRTISLYILYCSLPVLIHTPFCATLTVMEKWMHPFKYIQQIIFIREVSLYLCMYLALIQTITSLFMPNCTVFQKEVGYFFSSFELVLKNIAAAISFSCENSRNQLQAITEIQHPTEALFLGFAYLPAVNIIHSILLYFGFYFCGVFLICLALLCWQQNP